MDTNHWWQSAVFYELYVDKFAGNFQGLTEHLGYFETLGINVLHILPHYPSPMVDDGYDVSDYRNVRPELGTLQDFKALVREARRLGIHIIVDLVLNHVSREHPWFAAARRSRSDPLRVFFIWSETKEVLKDSINAFPHLKPLNWIYNPATNDYYYATFYPEQPDLNWNNPDVFAEMTAIMDFWIDSGVDGFRLDAASHLVKKEGTRSKGIPETHAVLKRIHAHLEEHAPRVMLLAEVHDPVPEIKKYFGDGTGNECHMAYHFPLAAKLILAALRNDPSPVEKMVGESFDIPSDCRWAVFLRSHDHLSLATLAETEQDELLTFCDPDQRYGFRSENGISMRIGSIFKKNPEKIRSAFDMLLKLPAPPIIYYGEEIGMENDATIGTPADTRRYVRGKFDWQLALAQQKNPNSLFHFVRECLRKRNRPS